MKRILKLKQKRMNLVTQAREILNKAQGESRSLSQEEENQYDNIMADVDEMGKEIQREERMAELESQMEQRSHVQSKPDPQKPSQEQRSSNPRATEEYRSAFWTGMRSGANSLTGDQYNLLHSPEVRALAIGTDAAGGYVVPDEYERNLIKKIEDANIMRSLVTVIQTGSGTRELPFESDYGTASWGGEASNTPESDAVFGIKTIGAHKLHTLIKISEELMNDAFFDIEDYVSSAFARRFARAEETAFINGDGNGKPLGLIQSATEGKTGVLSGITPDDMIDIFHSLKRVYRSNASWLMADSTVKVIRKLKDNDGQYIWQPGITAGQPDRILNRPVHVSDDVPTMGAGVKSILFGDYKHYTVADRKGRTMQRLNELYAATGQIGFRSYARLDGKLLQPNAVVYFKNSAT
ncbi:phage major capsid protein [Peribacillus asahii]|uniref:phage major capsid protein n=1 Tax=Peribacillus asahii TaxID=228899 RepID=UPI00207A7DF1|nr:phage major capsid protein [Peribacillus asahii]USK85722.1 phage major capsid protein [Peribacillus asahii]